LKKKKFFFIFIILPFLKKKKKMSSIHVSFLNGGRTCEILCNESSNVHQLYSEIRSTAAQKIGRFEDEMILIDLKTGHPITTKDLELFIKNEEQNQENIINVIAVRDTSFVWTSKIWWNLYRELEKKNDEKSLSLLLEILGEQMEPRFRQECLLVAASRGFDEMVNLLLFNVPIGSKCSKNINTEIIGADPNLFFDRRNQRTALHLACRNGHVHVVKALLAAGADQTYRDAKGFTPLLTAALRNKSEIVNLLIEAAGWPIVDPPNMKRRCGRFALMARVQPVLEAMGV